MEGTVELLPTFGLKVDLRVDSVHRLPSPDKVTLGRYTPGCLHRFFRSS